MLFRHYYMKKESWILGLSIISLMISVIAVCVATYRTSNLEFDYQGVIVGVLSLLVTVLIGWNIYTLIDIKDTSRKMSKFQMEIDSKTKKLIGETQLNLKVEMMNTVPILIAYQTGDLIASIKLMFKEFHENSNNESIAKIMAREYILHNIMGIINNDNKDLKKHFIDDLKGSIRIEEIEDFLHEFLSYSEDDKRQRYAGMQNVLLELLKAQS